jgi:hypothetical protein
MVSILSGSRLAVGAFVAGAPSDGITPRIPPGGGR